MWLLVVVFGAGFAAMAYEIVWFRTFVFILDSNILSFSMVLGTLLLALGIGSIAFPWVVRDRARHLEALGWIELGLGLTAGLTVLLFLRFDLVVGVIQSLGRWSDAFASLPGRSAPRPRSPDTSWGESSLTPVGYQRRFPISRCVLRFLVNYRVSTSCSVMPLS